MIHALLFLDCRNMFLLPNSIVAAGVVFSIFKQRHVVCVKAQECEVHSRWIFSFNPHLPYNEWMTLFICLLMPIKEKKIAE